MKKDEESKGLRRYDPWKQCPQIGAPECEGQRQGQRNCLKEKNGQKCPKSEEKNRHTNLGSSINSNKDKYKETLKHIIIKLSKLLIKMISYMQNNEIRTLPHTIYKTNSKRIKDLNVGLLTFLSDNNIRIQYYHNSYIYHGSIFLNM